MSRTVIVTPFGRADQLAAACVLSDIPGEVVPIGDFSAIVLSGTDIAEGNAAAAQISKLAGRHEVDMPICQGVTAVVDGQATPAQLTGALMSRARKHERA